MRSRNDDLVPPSMSAAAVLRPLTWSVNESQIDDAESESRDCVRSPSSPEAAAAAAAALLRLRDRNLARGGADLACESLDLRFAARRIVGDTQAPVSTWGPPSADRSEVVAEEVADCRERGWLRRRLVVEGAVTALWSRPGDGGGGGDRVPPLPPRPPPELPACLSEYFTLLDKSLPPIAGWATTRVQRRSSESGRTAQGRRRLRSRRSPAGADWFPVDRRDSLSAT